MKHNSRAGAGVCPLFLKICLFAMSLMAAVSARPSSSATAGSLGVSVSTLAFGNQMVGTVSAPKTVTLANTGQVAVTILEVGTFGVYPGDYARTTTCGASLAVAKTCSVTVTFKPSGTGPRYAAVFVRDNAAGSPQIIALTGTGVAAPSPAPKVSVPASLGFGSVPVSPASAQKVVTVTNTGNAALSFNRDPSLGGANEMDFAVTSSTCSITQALAAGASCTVTLTFAPSPLAEAESASLTFSDNASPATQTVSLSGTGQHWIGIQGTASPTPGVSGYHVYRGTSSGVYGAAPVMICASITTATSCMDADSALMPGMLYYYIVKAVLNGVESAPSNQASAIFP